MSAEKMLTSITQSRAPATMYGYPATALVAELGNGSNYIHIIYGSGDAGDTPGSLYDNAPNGSLYIPLTATAGNKKLYVKFGAKGLIDGAWQSESAAAYSGKLSQASTNAPTVVGAKNNTGQTATFAYVSGGTYTLTFGAAIAADADHVQVQITNALTSGIGLITAYASSSSVIQIRSLDVASGSLDNGLMDGASIRVTVTE